MYKFFFNISLRNLTRRSVFSFINILSLSIGLSVVLLICLLIYNELSFDRSFKESGNIYRVNAELSQYMPGEVYCTINNMVAPAMEAAIPEVRATTRTYLRSYITRINNNPLRIRFVWADEAFFRLFDTPFLQGSPETVMSRPNTVAISETMANTLFGDRSPMGESFVLDNEYHVEVMAIYKDYPTNTSFYGYHVIAPYQYCYPAHRLRQTMDWEDTDYETFCLLTEGADIASVTEQVKEVSSSLMGNHSFFVPSLQRLDKIHLYSSKYHRSNTSFQSDIAKVRMLSLLAVIILLIACINYMNLSTARAQKSAKEIGISKTLGVKRGRIICRLLFETGVLTFISFIFAFVFALLILPLFNNMLNEQLTFTLAFNPLFILGVVAIWIITTIIAASYPAVYLSSFPPLMAIRQSIPSGGSSHAIVRKTLSIGQFAIAIVLISWVITIQMQMRYINNKDIGYNPNNLISISSSLPEETNLDALINDYNSLSSVVMVSGEHQFLFGGSRNILRRGSDDRQGTTLITMCVDHNFVDLMELKLIAGTTLPKRNPNDSITQMVINRKAADYLGISPEDIIGRRIMAEFPESPAVVCGVVENFNYESLYRPVEPYALYNGRENRPVLMLRVREGNLSEQLSSYEEVFKRHFPNELFEVSFPDIELERAYETERRTNRIAICFSILAILVACLGVFGLTAFTAEQRRKEIGIRKVLGASVNDIVHLFTKDYIRLLLIALLIALPVAWWIGNRYLEEFAYRIDITWWVFAVAALLTATLTLLTVGFQAIRVAMANPVKSIKTE